MNKIETHIFKRLDRNIDWKWLQFICQDDFYIAGNSLNMSTPNDIDIFPTVKDQFRDIEIKEEFDKIVSNTNNALTVIHNGTVYQFCNYYHNSLKELVNSFDFSHIQIGAHVGINEDFEDSIFEFKELYMSENYINSRLMGDTEYQGSEFPTSSLIRLIKYVKRGDFAGKSYIPAIIKIIVSISKRGFKDYKDFKNQLDAIDLGLIPKELDGFKPWDMILIEFYNCFTKTDKKYNFSEDE